MELSCESRCVVKKTLIILVLTIFLSRTLFALEADIQNIPSDQYFSVTLSEISKAKESIYLVMYLASYDPAEPNSQVSQLLKALADAKARGVQIKVMTVSQ